jgi:hypothetical protein
MRDLLSVLQEEPSFLHVGFPKCASSFFENRYFVECNGFFNVIEDPQWNNFLEYQMLTAQASLFRRSQVPGKTVVPADLLVGISSATFLTGIDYELSLQRWKKIAPNSRVLIVVRNQLDFIYSGYGQRILSGYFRSVDEHIRELIWDVQRSVWGRLFYDQIFQITKNVFDDVLVLPLERMTRGNEYITELNSFFGVDNRAKNNVVRPSLNENTLRLIRGANWVFRHGIGSPQMSILPSYEGGIERFRVNGVPGKEPSGNRRRAINRLAKSVGQRMPQTRRGKKRYLEKNKNLFEDWFGESNRRLEKAADLDLSEYHYVGTGYVGTGIKQEP